MEYMSKKVLIAMSGGVDSSVAAALMTQRGYDCIGCTMKLQGQESSNGEVKPPSSDADTVSGVAEVSIPAAAASPASALSEDTGLEDVSSAHTCCSLEDVEDARAVARKLGMPYYVFNFSEDFGEKVIDRFIRIYKAGGTPNPCIDCNRYMKFGRLYHRSRVLGCDAVVTGHYARIRFDETSGRWQLLRSNNPGKDQTYVLYAMTQEQLAHTILPLGEYPDKETVREVAKEYGFINSQKADSQDLCFVPDGKYADFIERRCGEEAPHGDFVDEEGNVLGEHRGLIRYTIGQRRGLGLALPAPLYVSRIDTEKNQVVLTPEDRLFTRRLIAEDFNWIWTRDWGSWESNPESYRSEEMQNFAADDKAFRGSATDQSSFAENAGTLRITVGQREEQNTSAVGKQSTSAEGEQSISAVGEKSISTVGKQNTSAEEEPNTPAEKESADNLAAKIFDTPPAGYICEVTAKPRYRSKEAPATARVLEGGKVEIVFHEPQRALTIGQAVVLYDGENVVGGGTITQTPED